MREGGVVALLGENGASGLRIRNSKEGRAVRGGHFPAPSRWERAYKRENKLLRKGKYFCDIKREQGIGSVGARLADSGGDWT